jgi:hypothetical protein
MDERLCVKSDVAIHDALPSLQNQIVSRFVTLWCKEKEEENERERRLFQKDVLLLLCTTCTSRI